MQRVTADAESGAAPCGRPRDAGSGRRARAASPASARPARRRPATWPPGSGRSRSFGEMNSTTREGRHVMRSLCVHLRSSAALRSLLLGSILRPTTRAMGPAAGLDRRAGQLHHPQIPPAHRQRALHRHPDRRRAGTGRQFLLHRPRHPGGARRHAAESPTTSPRSDSPSRARPRAARPSMTASTSRATRRGSGSTARSPRSPGRPSDSRSRDTPRSRFSRRWCGTGNSTGSPARLATLPGGTVTIIAPRRRHGDRERPAAGPDPVQRRRTDLGPGDPLVRCR